MTMTDAASAAIQTASSSTAASRPRPASVPRRPAPPRRPPPPKREQLPDVVDVAELARQNQQLLERIEQLESGQVRYVQSQPELPADVRVADPSALPPFVRKLLERVHDVPEGFEAASRGRPYNYPDRLYVKPDGTIVALQGSPEARALYQDKGYYCLSTDEERHYRQVEYPKILAETRRKAHLITTIRNMFKREPSLSGWREDSQYDASLDLMSIEQLTDEWEDLRARSINPGQKLPPMPRFKSDSDVDRNMVGIETTPPPRIRPAGHREIEVTPETANTFA